MKYQRISKSGFLWAYCGTLGLALLMSCCAGVAGAAKNDNVEVPLIVVTIISVLFFVATHFVFIYRIWREIQDGHTRISAGKAMGLLLIPIFNLYWSFHALWGFAREYNLLLKRHRIERPKLGEGLYLAYPMLVSISVLIGVCAFLILVVCLPRHGPLSEDPSSTILIIIMIVVSLINQVLGIALFVIGILIISRSCDAINALPMLKPVEVSYQSPTDYPASETTP